MTIKELRKLYNTSCAAVQTAAGAVESASKDISEEDLTVLRSTLDEAIEEAERTKSNLEFGERAENARTNFTVVDTGGTEADTEEIITNIKHPDIYRRDNNFDFGFFSDMFRRDFLGDNKSSKRLSDHYGQVKENATEREQRDIGTGAFAGLVIPQYLVDLYAPLARAGRPFANKCRQLPLPPAGMTLNISRLTTGTAVAVQAAENDAAQETNSDDTLLTINVRTIAGQQDVSRQLLERGTPSMDEIIFQDLLSAYHTLLDSQIISADGTSGTHLGLLNVSGINAVTYTDASPTVPEIYPKLADAIQQIASGRYFPADLICLHPRRWGWFTAALDSNNRPLVVPVAAGPYMAAGVNQTVGYGEPLGNLQGLPVITDANVPTNLGAGTNEDIAIFVRSQDMLLWEEGDGTPRQARFEQTLGGSLTVKLVLYGYSAFAGGRYPEAVGTIGGTGLITPTF